MPDSILLGPVCLGDVKWVILSTYDQPYDLYLSEFYLVLTRIESRSDPISAIGRVEGWRGAIARFQPPPPQTRRADFPQRAFLPTFAPRFM